MTVASVHPDLKSLVSRRLDELGYGGRRMSYRRAAEKARSKGCRVSPETVRQIDVGSHSGRIEDDTVAALAAALDVGRGDILRAMHEQRSAPLGEWQPPAAANRLTLQQRRAIEHLISVMTSADDRPMNEQSSGDEVGRQRSLAVKTDRFTSSNNETITQADAGELVPQSDAEREYVDTLSDAALDRLRARLLGE